MSGRPSPDQDLAEWVRLAEQDLLAAEDLLTIREDAEFEVITYHAQQCAEKYLKALLVQRGIVFPRTHDLRALSQLLPSDVRFGVAFPDLLSLNRYTVESRYPGPWDPIERAEAEAAVRVAHELRDSMRALLGLTFF